MERRRLDLRALGSSMAAVGALAFTGTWLLVPVVMGTYSPSRLVIDAYVVSLALICLVASRARNEWILLTAGSLLVVPFGLYFLGSPAAWAVAIGLLSLAAPAGAILLAIGKRRRERS